MNFIRRKLKHQTELEPGFPVPETLAEPPVYGQNSNSIITKHVPDSNPILKEELKQLIEESRKERLIKYKQDMIDNSIKLFHDIIDRDASLGKYHIERKQYRCGISYSEEMRVGEYITINDLEQISKSIKQGFANDGFEVEVKYCKEPVTMFDIKIYWKNAKQGTRANKYKEISDEINNRPILKDDLKLQLQNLNEITTKNITELETHMKRCIKLTGVIPQIYTHNFDKTATTDLENSEYKLIMENVIANLPKEFTLVKGNLKRNIRNAISGFWIEYMYEL